MDLEMFRGFAIALLIFVILDGVWLGLIIKKTYSRLLSGFKLRRISLLSALITYIFLAVGISFFVIPRAESVGNAVLNGALYGFLLYGFYNFTNYSIFENYKFEFVLIDMVWGAFASGIASALVFISI